MFYYIAIKYTHNLNYSILLLLMLTLLGYIICPYFKLGEWWYGSSIGFNLGMVVKQYEDRIQDYFSKYIYIAISFVPIVLMIIYLSSHFSSHINVYLEVSALGFSFIILTLIYVCGFFSSNLTTWLGKHSYEIYLCHPMVLTLYPYWKYHSISGNILFGIVAFFITFILSFILKQVVGNLLKLLNL